MGPGETRANLPYLACLCVWIRNPALGWLQPSWLLAQLVVVEDCHPALCNTNAFETYFRLEFLRSRPRCLWHHSFYNRKQLLDDVNIKYCLSTPYSIFCRMVFIMVHRATITVFLAKYYDLAKSILSLEQKSSTVNWRTIDKPKDKPHWKLAEYSHNVKNTILNKRLLPTNFYTTNNINLACNILMVLF